VARTGPLGTLAKRFGKGKDTIAKVWADQILKPWNVSTFKISNDASFEAPPAHPWLTGGL